MLDKKYFIYLEIKNHNSRLHLDKKEKSKEHEKENFGQNLRSTTKIILNRKLKMIHLHCEKEKKKNFILS